MVWCVAGAEEVKGEDRKLTPRYAVSEEEEEEVEAEEDLSGAEEDSSGAESAVMSESGSAADDSSSEEDEEAESPGGWRDQEEDSVPLSDTTSRRIALCNMDWDHVGARDIYGELEREVGKRKNN